MNITKFIAEFGHIASSSQGIARVREMILSLAFSGDLISRDFNNNSDLIELIKTLISSSKSGRVRKASSALQPSMMSNEIPEGWSWLTLADIGHTLGQTKPDTFFTYIDVSSIDNKRGVINKALKVIAPGQAPGRARKRVQKGSVIYSTIRPNLLNVAIVDEDFEYPAIASTAFAVIHPWDGISSKYIYYYLRSPYFIDYINSVQAGMAYPAISDEKFYKAAIPIPSTKEQDMIVKKIDTLMTMCDLLDDLITERDEVCHKTRTAILNSFIESDRSISLEESWAMFNSNFDILFNSVKGLSDLKGFFMDLAVTGLLAKLNHSDVERELPKQYTFNKLIKDTEITDKYKKFQFPEHWVTLPFGEISTLRGGVTKGRLLKNKQIKSCPYLRVANVQRGHFDLSEIKEIEIPIDEISKYRLEHGDLLITEGGDWDKVGRTAIWQAQLPECIHQNHVFRARINSPLVINSWIELVFNSSVGREYFAVASKQTTNLASINMAQLKKFPVPIPPIEEQRMLLNSLVHLSKYCERLTDKSREAQALAYSFATAAVATISGTKISDNERMKKPKTQLISDLTIGMLPDDDDDASPLSKILMSNGGKLSSRGLWLSSGLDIDEFYQQLRHEISKGWIAQPEVGHVNEIA